MKKILSILLIMSLLCACQMSKNNTDTPNNNEDVILNEAAVKGGILPLQMRPVDTLNPILTTQQSTRDVLLISYEPLIKIDETFSLVPCLASTYFLSDDAKNLTIKLRSDIKWHDGKTFTSKDVVYTINLLMNTPTSSYYALVKDIESVEAVDNLTVVIHMKKSYSQILYALYFPIIPEHITNLDETIMGTGPYMLDSYIPLQQLNLKQNPLWHGSESYIDKIQVALIKDDQTATDAFSTNRIYAITSDSLDLNNYALKQNMSVKHTPTNKFEFIGFNNTSGVFASNSMRCAVACGIDRDEIIQRVYGKYDTPANLPIHKASSLYSPSSSLCKYDAEYARELIFFDGWSDIDGNGTLEQYSKDDEKPQLLNLSFDLLVNNDNQRRVNAANVICEQLTKLGITVNVIAVDWNEYMSRITTKQYDAFIGGTTIGVCYDIDFLLNSTGNTNYFGYSSIFMDNALNNFASAESDASFKEYAIQIQDIFEREQPLCGIAFLSNALVTSNNVGGDLSPSLFSPYSNISKWFVKNQNNL